MYRIHGFTIYIGFLMRNVSTHLYIFTLLIETKPIVCLPWEILHYKISREIRRSEVRIPVLVQVFLLRSYNVKPFLQKICYLQFGCHIQYRLIFPWKIGYSYLDKSCNLNSFFPWKIVYRYWDKSFSILHFSQESWLPLFGCHFKSNFILFPGKLVTFIWICNFQFNFSFFSRISYFYLYM